MTRISTEDVAWLQTKLHGDDCRQCNLVRGLLTEHDALVELNKAITWDTTCLNCSNLLDQLYEQDMKLEQIQNVVPPECWVTRSADVFCSDMVGGTIGASKTEFAEETCCLPCRIRTVLAS